MENSDIPERKEFYELSDLNYEGISWNGFEFCTIKNCLIHLNTSKFFKSRRKIICACIINHWKWCEYAIFC